MPRPADAGAVNAFLDEALDEALDESFPASDPLSFWSGRDFNRGDVPETVPEADDPRVARVWAESESMEGPAPTG
jgi:hypothetical protein